MAASSSGSTASSSRATAEPTPRAFRAAVDVGYDMVRYELLNKIRDTLVRHASEEAAAGKVEAAS